MINNALNIHALLTYIRISFKHKVNILRTKAEIEKNRRREEITCE